MSEDALVASYRKNPEYRAVVSLSSRTSRKDAHAVLIQVLDRVAPPIHGAPPYFFNYPGCHRVIWVSKTHPGEVVTPCLIESYRAQGFEVWETTQIDLYIWEAAQRMVDGRTVWTYVKRMLKGKGA